MFQQGCLNDQANIAWFTSTRGVYPDWDCVESNTSSPFFTGAKKLHLTLDWDNFDKNSVHKGAGYTGLIFIVIYY